MKQWHRIRKALSLPVSVVVRHGLRVAKRRLVGRVRPVNPESALHKNPAQQGHFPADFFLKNTVASRETADRICRHEFDLLGSGLKKLGEKIDWHRDFKHDVSFPHISSEKITYDFSGGSDIKVPWELSRFQFLPTLAKTCKQFNDERYALEARSLIEDWNEKNPLGIGVNWKCTMDVAIRACNWAVCWYLLNNSQPWQNQEFTKMFLTSIIEHGRFIYANLEYGPGFNSNHLLSDLVGLLFLGILFPEAKEAQRWKKRAIKELEKEMLRQVYPGGVDFEASISYHRLVTEFFGWSALLCKTNEIALSPHFFKQLEKMFEFVWHYTKPNGLAPQIGDNDDGRLFILEDFYAWNRRDHTHLFALAHELFPMNKKFDQNGAGMPRKSTAFPDGGIYILRSGTRSGLVGPERVPPKEGGRAPDRSVELPRRGELHGGNQGFPQIKSKNIYCMVDCGSNGQKGNAGHAHNDTLSFELSVGGEDFIIDPGTYVYTSDPGARNRFRGTQMHNTVMIDNKEMNRFRDETLFSMYDDAQPIIHRWVTTDERDELEAAHTGYARLPDPVIHKRYFDFYKNEEKLEITDSFTPPVIANPACGAKQSTLSDKHSLQWNFHFAPGVEVQLEKENVLLKKNNTTLHFMLPAALAHSAVLHDDHVSPSYGVLERSLTLRLNTTIDVGIKHEFKFTLQPFTFNL